jgi:hypothetical protein
VLIVKGLGGFEIVKSKLGGVISVNFAVLFSSGKFLIECLIS